MSDLQPNGNGGRSITGLSVPLLLVAGLLVTAFTAGGMWVAHSTRVEDLERRVERIERLLQGSAQWKGPF